MQIIVMMPGQVLVCLAVIMPLNAALSVPLTAIIHQTLYSGSVFESGNAFDNGDPMTVTTKIPMTVHMPVMILDSQSAHSFFNSV
jgi:hypothetical protein